MPDGNALQNRVNILGTEKIHGSVINNVLNNPTLWSRFQGMGQKFSNKRMDFVIKATNSGRGKFFTGAETLSTAAADTRIQLQYLDTSYEQPVVSIGTELIRNSNGVIDLHKAELDDAVAEMTTQLGTAIYAGPTAKQPLGLGSIIDDGTNAGTIGGQSRTTYTNLKATVTASGGTLTLAKLATLHSTISESSPNEEPTIHVTPTDVWDNYESLLQPTVVARYADVGMNSLPVRGKAMVRSNELKGGAGFTALTYKTMPVIKDKFCTADTWFMINENYTGWYGRSDMPGALSPYLSKVSLGQPKTMTGADFVPSEHHGMYFKKEQMPVNQLAIVGHYILMGQMITTQPRRNGKLTGITGV